MNYIAPRNMTVASVSGRSVTFVKGVPTYAPDQMHAELIQCGVVPAEEIPEPPDDGSPKEPTLPPEREAALFKAFEAIILRGKREDFTAVGVPHNAVLVKQLGWTQISNKERDAAWQKLQASKAP